jgi:hypothetical protein
MMLRRLLLPALTLALVLPATATAGTIEAALPQAQKIAAEHWGPDACTGRVTLLPMTARSLARVRAPIGTPARALEYVSADAAWQTCTIRVALDFLVDRTELCLVIVHEYGHLHRLRFANPGDAEHSPRRGSVMNAQASVPPVACLDAFEPFQVREYERLGWTCRFAATDWVWRCRKIHRYEREVEPL